MMLTGSQIFVEVLAEQGVDTIFGYPGGAVLNLYDELYKNSDRIRHILTAHEQGHADTACQRCHEQKMSENLLAHLYTPPLSIGFQFASRSDPGRWLSGNGSSG